MSEFECWTTKMEQVMNMEVVEMECHDGPTVEYCWIRYQTR